MIYFNAWRKVGSLQQQQQQLGSVYETHKIEKHLKIEHLAVEFLL